eukprot:1149495-Pelagomonas_calceolata.AAC.8
MSAGILVLYSNVHFRAKCDQKAQHYALNSFWTASGCTVFAPKVARRVHFCQGSLQGSAVKLQQY